MSSSKTNTTASDAVKSQKTTAPNFVLSLLAACSSSVPTAGSEGEAKLVDQLSSLLQDKAMALDELSLTYSYKFGLSISDALKLLGFAGKLPEFLDEKKCFCLHEGCVSLVSATAAATEEATATEHEMEPCAKVIDDEVASIAETESTTDAESCHQDSDSEVDVAAWNSVGNRLVAVLGSPSVDEADDDGDDVEAWQALGDRVATVLRDSDDEDGVDVEAWCDVGSRLLRACDSCNDDEEHFDADQWHSVGVRVLQRLDTWECDADLDQL